MSSFKLFDESTMPTCARESRCDPFANLKVTPLAGHVCKGIKIHFTFHLFSVIFD
jgi:hypothetical protein